MQARRTGRNWAHREVCSACLNLGQPLEQGEGALTVLAFVPVRACVRACVRAGVRVCSHVLGIRCTYIYTCIHACVRIRIAGLRVGANEEMLAIGDRVDPATGVDQATLLASSFIPVDKCIDRRMRVGMYMAWVKTYVRDVH